VIYNKGNRSYLLQLTNVASPTLSAKLTHLSTRLLWATKSIQVWT